MQTYTFTFAGGRESFRFDAESDLAAARTGRRVADALGVADWEVRQPTGCGRGRFVADM